jgi:hypothetical protein
LTARRARPTIGRNRINRDEEDKRLVDTPEPPHADADTNNEETDAVGDDSLQDLAREQPELARERLTRELGREPTEDEIDDWLRRQTEGY